MNRCLSIGTVCLLCLLVALPAAAQKGFGKQGKQMVPGFGGGRQDQLDPEIAALCREAGETHRKETEALRRDILSKRHEMAAMLTNPESKLDDLLKKQEKLQKLTNELQRRDLIFRWNFFKKHPEISPDMQRGCIQMLTGMGGQGPAGRRSPGTGPQNMMEY